MQGAATLPLIEGKHSRALHTQGHLDDLRDEGEAMMSRVVREGRKEGLTLTTPSIPQPAARLFPQNLP